MKNRGATFDNVTKYSDKNRQSSSSPSRII